MFDVAWKQLIWIMSAAFVLEGILPFIQPSYWRKLMSILIKQSDSSIRIVGLSSMILGLGIMYVTR